MDKILPAIGSPHDLQKLSQQELTQLAAEIREALCGLASRRTAHFASNLGVVELTLALHTTFDFSRDRLIWDTGHQIYPHKLVTGRFNDFNSMRVRGGLMEGYSQPGGKLTTTCSSPAMRAAPRVASWACAVPTTCCGPRRTVTAWRSSATGPSAPALCWRP